MDDWIDLREAKRALREGTGRGVKIAILDSGVETSHPKLGGMTLVDDLVVEIDGHKLRVVKGEGLDVFGHGTAVAGVIRQMAPEARIGSIRVLGGDNTSRTRVILRAAQEAMDRGYHVLNCSFGCGVERHVLRYKEWVDEAYLKGIHVVAACDNVDFSRPEWPAFFSSVIAVNMARTDDDSVFFYQRGTLVEFSAKAVDVEVPWAGGGFKLVTGSSFAAPRLAALLSRLLSEHPTISPLTAKAILQQLAEPFTKEVAAENVTFA